MTYNLAITSAAMFVCLSNIFVGAWLLQGEKWVRGTLHMLLAIGIAWFVGQAPI